MLLVFYLLGEKQAHHMVSGLFCLMPLEYLALVAGRLNRLMSKSNEKVAVMVEWAQVADWLHALKGEG